MAYLSSTPILMTLLIYCAESSGQNLDPINILSMCGSECWVKDPNNKLPDHIVSEPQVFDNTVVRCMQTCFASKANKEVTEETPPHQVLKIKVSAYCGHICFQNNKHSKKSLDYCYVGCLGSILQPRVKNNIKTNEPKGV